MPLQASRLRRWFAIGALVMVAIVAGAYYYAKWRVDNALQQVKEKIGIEVKQSAQGFTISKSVGGRTLFKIQASKAIQYRQGEHAELHDVNITLYGEDSTRFDQIYGEDFEYDPQSGNVSAKGDVQIDLQANPEGLTHPDQALPKELKNPIHLKTSGLVFNQKTGNAYTKEKIEFRVTQASGSAVGATYESKNGLLTLQSQVVTEFQGGNSGKITAASATVSKQPELVTLMQPRGENGSEKFEADQIKFFLRPDHSLERSVASGSVLAQSKGKQPLEIRAQELDVRMTDKASLNTARFSGNVRWETPGEEAMSGEAGSMLLEFGGNKQPRKVRLDQAVELRQRQSMSKQSFNLTAPAMDFILVNGRLGRAETLGAGKIVVIDESGQETRALADKFTAQFSGEGLLAALHGGTNARIESSVSGEPDRVSTSDTVDVIFAAKGGAQSITQKGNVVYHDESLQATGNEAIYTAADQSVVLSGDPRVVTGGMTATADRMLVKRKTGEISAEGNVKSTYSDLKPQASGILLASGDPVHVTARAVSARRKPPMATYSGNVRLWQQANVVEAPNLSFDRDRRSVEAHASGGKKVTTTLIQLDNKKQPKPLTIVSGTLSYLDASGKVHFGDDVLVRLDEITLTAREMDALRQPDSDKQSSGSPRIGRIVAEGQVNITQPGRRAMGEILTYTSEDEKFVLTGGIPSIFDAERGKITGDSLTFFRRDARVLVEGSTASPAVTQTRVAR